MTSRRLAWILPVCLSAACNNSGFSGESASYRSGADRDRGTGSKEDVMRNSAFDDEYDTDRGRSGSKRSKGRSGEKSSDAERGETLGRAADDGIKTAAGSGKGQSGGDVAGDEAELGKRRVNLSVPFRNFCSKDATEAVRTNVTTATGIKVKFLDAATGALVMEYTADPRKIRDDLINTKAMTMTFNEGKAPPSGTYALALCDVASACPVDKAWFDKVRRDLPKEKDTNGGEGGALHVWEKARAYPGLLGFVTEASVSGDKLTVAQNAWALYMGPDGDQYKDCNYSNSPLLVDLDGTGLKLSSITGGVRFDIGADGKKEQISWPAKRANVFLALDLNGNGRIDDAGELFGNNSRGPDGEKAANGFLALAKYDANGDGSIDAADPIWKRLRLWSDANGNGVGEPHELKELGAAGVRRFDLAYCDMETDSCALGLPMQVDAYGNEQRQRSVVELTSGEKRLVVDIWFRIVPGL